MPAPSYVSGISQVPLLGETIGQNLRRTVERVPGSEALVSVPQGYRATYRAVLGRDLADRSGAHGAGREEGRPGRHLVAQPLRVGDHPVRHRPHGRDPGERQPRLPPARAGVRAQPVGRLDPAAGQALPERRLRGDGARGPAALPRARADHRHRRRVELAQERRAQALRGRAAGAGARAAVRRRHQHPVHERHDRVPQGSDPVAPQHPQQRLLHRRVLPLHREGPGLHPGPVLPLLRHGARQPGHHHPRRLHGHPGRELRSAGGA